MDAEPTDRGTFILMGWDDPPVAVRHDPVAGPDDPLNEVRERYVCHFATCPSAAEHRSAR